MYISCCVCVSEFVFVRVAVSFISSYALEDEQKASKVFPEVDESHWARLGMHPPTKTGSLLDVLAVIGDNATSHEVKLLGMLEVWQIAYAKVKSIDLEEAEAVRASSSNLFSLSLKTGGLAPMLQDLAHKLTTMTEYSALSQHRSASYNFSGMLSEIQKCNEACETGQMLFAVVRCLLLFVEIVVAVVC